MAVDPYSREAFEGPARVMRVVTDALEHRNALPYNMRHINGVIEVFDIPTGNVISRYKIKLEEIK